MPTFIETQFPIARLTAESYKERKANLGQTLTRLGKWWGRKPLILVRAAILGMLMPASDDPKADRDIFLKILTMDDAGTLGRWMRSRRFTDAELEQLSQPHEVQRWRELAELYASAKEEYQATLRAHGRGSQEYATADREKADRLAELTAYKDELQTRAFHKLSYADRLARCERPENVAGPSEQAWDEINAHLGTTANSLTELVHQLGEWAFGHAPRVGDCFCGGGSIPFEAARIGCQAYGSDLNPVAALLTWASLNLLGGGKEIQAEVMRVQEEVLQAADRQITDWGIEHNDQGERADAYLYCVEVKPEGCDYYIPLAPSWLIGERSKVVAKWHRVPGSDRLQPEIVVVSDDELRLYKDKHGATVIDSRVVDPFDPNRSWSLEALRGPNGLRRWTNEDVTPRPEDVFQERLYCIRWVEQVIDTRGKIKEIRRYAAPDQADLNREATALALLRERFHDWQDKGFIPSKEIPKDGVKTEEPIRNRGWTYWHHLFTPRQLLTHGCIFSIIEDIAVSKEAQVACMLGLGRLANWDSKLCLWDTSPANEKGKDVFLNQALNTLTNFSGRPLQKYKTAWPVLTKLDKWHGSASSVESSDARSIQQRNDLWITDPPYADAVNYHELGDFFLAWYDKQLARVFPEWIADSRAELAVRGDGEDFRRAMVDIYRNLARNMPDNGMQMVMFTHQNPAVWADLGMILWAAGLMATAAWTISTETDAVGIKKGNYVQGTVCLVLRKRVRDEPGFLDEVYPLVEDEVRRQITSMQALDAGDEPNFNDANYQLAAYAAALKVLTRYGSLDGRDVEHEVFAVRSRDRKSDFQAVIERALGIACDTLVPRGLTDVWRDLSLAERYYLRSLDIESRGERRKGMYEELARGFGVTDIRPLLKTDKANGTRMHTPRGFGGSVLADPAPVSGAGGQAGLSGLSASGGRTRTRTVHPFAPTPLRHLLFAVRETVRADGNPEPGRQYLRDTFGQGYWNKREHFLGLLHWLASLGNAQGMAEWAADSEAARILAGRLRNDHS
jgi:putative DNA methylase